MATESTLTSMVSVRSISVTVMVSVSEMEVLVSVRAEVSSPLVMTGESLVPVMVMATVVVSESEEPTPLSSWRVSV